MALSPRETRTFLSTAGTDLSVTLSRIANDVALASHDSSSLDFSRAIALSLRNAAGKAGVQRVSASLLPRGSACAALRVDVTTPFSTSSASVSGSWSWAAAANVTAVARWVAATDVALQGTDATALHAADAAVLRAVVLSDAAASHETAAAVPSTLLAAFRLATSVAIARAGAAVTGASLVSHLETAARVAAAEAEASGGSARNAVAASATLRSAAGSSDSAAASAARAASMQLAFSISHGDGALVGPFRGYALWAGAGTEPRAACSALPRVSTAYASVRAVLADANALPHPAADTVFAAAGANLRRAVAALDAYNHANHPGGGPSVPATLEDAALLHDSPPSAPHPPMLSILWAVGADHLHVTQALLDAEAAKKKADEEAAAAAAAAVAAAAAAAPPAKGKAAPPTKAAPPAKAPAKGGKEAAPPPPPKPDARTQWELDLLSLPLPADATPEAESVLYDFSLAALIASQPAHAAPAPAQAAHAPHAVAHTPAHAAAPAHAPVHAAAPVHAGPDGAAPRPLTRISSPRLLEFVSLAAASVGPVVGAVWDAVAPADAKGAATLPARLRAATVAVAAAKQADADKKLAEEKAAAEAAALAAAKAAPKGKAAPAPAKGAKGAPPAPEPAHVPAAEMHPSPPPPPPIEPTPPPRVLSSAMSTAFADALRKAEVELVADVIATASQASPTGSSETDSSAMPVFSLTASSGASGGSDIGRRYAAACVKAARASVDMMPATSADEHPSTLFVLPFGGRISSLSALLALALVAKKEGQELLIDAAASSFGAGADEEEGGCAATVAVAVGATALLLGSPEKSSTLAALEELDTIETLRAELTSGAVSAWPLSPGR